MDWDEAYNLHIWDQVRDHLDQIEDEVKFRDYAERSGERVCTGDHDHPSMRLFGESCRLCGAQT